VTSCSLQSSAVAEPLAGTAPTACAWIIIEHTGPWGRDALADSDLPTAVREHLAGAKSLGITVLLARHPDRLERRGAEGVNVWVARAAAGGARLRHDVLPDLDPLTRWDLAALAEGSLPALGSAVPEPLLLVCTHSKRDQCCAVHGRALITALLAQADPAHRARIWECSHIGGHRFAPVTLSLPSGSVHGRVPLDQVAALADATDAGRVLPELLRGRSCFPAPLQAADVAVRRLADIDGADDLDVLVRQGERAVPVDLGWAVPTGGVDLEVRHRDGRAWHATVQHESLGAMRAESCGADALPVHAWAVTDVAVADPWA
jgi:hypothetical protein